MKIGIIGGGAIGLLFAARLSTKHKIELFTNTKKQANSINQHGLRLIDGAQERSIIIPAFPIKEADIQSDLIIVAVKQYHLPTLWTVLNQFPNSTLLFLQNGIAHLPMLEELNSKAILVGVVEHGAGRLDERTVQHTGIGVTRYGFWKGEAFVNSQDLSSSSFPFVYEENPFLMLKEKLLVNCVINPLTALFQVRNGELLDNPYFFQLFTDTFNEVVLSLQLTPSKEKLFQKVKDICKQTSQNQSSMYKDLQQGRKTEMDAIVGSVLKEAEKNKIETPILQFLYKSIKGKEEKL